MKSTVLVFGASGFIGTHLLKQLAKTGNYTLIAADIVQPQTPVDSVTYHSADVRDLSTFAIDAPIDLIVNLAAIHKTPGHPTPAYYETNVLGAVEITAFARRNSIKEIIFTSSISVYGPGEETKTEKTPLAPKSAYGWSKKMAEKIHTAWVKENDDRRLIICRPAVIFGPHEGGNFCRLAALLKKGFFIYPGRKDTIKACFYVKDLIDAFLFARKQPDHLIIFNGCYADRYTIQNIVEIFCKNHFPKVKTFLLPRYLILIAATLLKPFSVFGLGIHPERVMKLVRSTDVMPEWLSSHGHAKTKALEAALEDWKNETAGRFD